MLLERQEDLKTLHTALRVHITQEHFERCFRVGKQPRVIKLMAKHAGVKEAIIKEIDHCSVRLWR